MTRTAHNLSVPEFVHPATWRDRYDRLRFSGQAQDQLIQTMNMMDAGEMFEGRVYKWILEGLLSRTSFQIIIDRVADENASNPYC